MRELSDGLWQHLSQAADIDSDGRISLTEYRTAFAAGMLVTPGSFDAGYEWTLVRSSAAWTGTPTG
ncbi:EF-hand domain-containing protein [Streptomyces sp. NPDC005899]|uniref:EF-hand domain-containing protein n=1 Tax=Streptomyces sp. NPDC005899 TaxID=3155716 RepID=UPI0034016001